MYKFHRFKRGHLREAELQLLLVEREIERALLPMRKQQFIAHLLMLSNYVVTASSAAGKG